MAKPMLKTILFDLDNTLLQSIDFDSLREEFARTLAQYFVPLVSLEQLHSAMSESEQAMDVNVATDIANGEIFLRTFSRETGLDISEVGNILERYWVEGFPKLRSCWTPIPEARKVIELVFREGLQVVIATGMQLSIGAIQEKLLWADIPVTDFNYLFISSMENMYSSKPQSRYYLEILEKIGYQAVECIMVGDDWEHDIAPADSVGIPCFWISEETAKQPDLDISVVGQGSLSNLLDWLQAESQS